MVNDKKVKVYFCPQCKSVNVKYTFGLKNLFGVIPAQKCGDCDFSAPSFPILETTTKNLTKNKVGSKEKKKAVKKKVKKTIKRVTKK